MADPNDTNPSPLDTAVAVAPKLHEASPIVSLLRPIGELAGGDVFGTAPPPQPWLLMRRPRPGKEELEGGGPGGAIGFLPLGEVGMLSSAGGSGKTMCLIELGLAVTTGRNWLGASGDRLSGYYVPAASRGRVALFLAEESDVRVWQRLHSAGKALGLSPAEVVMANAKMLIAPLKGRPAPLTRKEGAGETEETEHMKAIRAHLAALAADEPWRLIVIDPLARFADAGAEVDNNSATKFVQLIESLLFVNGPDAPPPTIIMAHHTSKAARAGLAAGADPSGNDARGASALVDSTRWGSTLTETPRAVCEALGFDVARLSLVKSNYTASAPIMLLKRETGGRLREMTADEAKAYERAMKAAARGGSDQGGGNGKPPPPPERSRTEAPSAIETWNNGSSRPSF